MTEKGANQNTIQEMNRSLILNVLRKQGVCSRAKISRITGLQQATITYIVNDLIKWKLVTETGLMTGKKGRRSIGISINNDVYRVIGVCLTRSYFSIGVFNLSGKLLESEQIDTVGNSPLDVLKKLKISLSGYIAKSKKKILSIGIGIPGPFIHDKNHIALMTGVPGWENIDIKTELETEFNIPIFMEHDANAGAYAQNWFVKDIKPSDVLLYVTMSAGIGAGVITNHEIFRGFLGTAGEIGHMSICFDGPECECGNLGCLEKYASSHAFADAISQKLQKKTSFEQAVKLVENNNDIAIQEYKNCCKMLGVALVNTVNILNPNIIVIGCEMAHVAPKILLETVDEVIKERTMLALTDQLIIKISNIEKGSVLMGAAVIAINEVLKNSSQLIDVKS